MLEYYCDNNRCFFKLYGWCTYWDSTIQLMKIRGVECSFDASTYRQIDGIMERCFR